MGKLDYILTSQSLSAFQLPFEESLIISVTILVLPLFLRVLLQI